MFSQPIKPPIVTSPATPHAQNTRPLPILKQNSNMMFSDGAWDPVTGRAGMGWLIKNRSGATLLQGSSNRSFLASSMVAEALAMKDAISSAINAGFKDLLCVTDCKSLADLITGNSSVTAIQGILYDIGILSRSLNSISYSFVPRFNNEAADSLAKSALAALNPL